jgi:catechol 2,3-dioxygenase-like lactoylglutathione lyase family enzyme
LESLRGLCIAILLGAATAWARPPQRPPITGISHMAVYTSNSQATEHFYVHDLGAAKEADPETPAGVCYYFSPTQFIEVLPLPPDAGINRLDHTAYLTPDAEGMLRYLHASKVSVPRHVERGVDGSRWFAVTDPEGNKVEFVEPGQLPSLHGAHPISNRIIHVGFLVHSRSAEDHFYREILGFRPYWYGGMQEGKLDWVSQQVPDGHDWLEYMLTSGPSGSGIPPHMSQSQLGVLDHFSLGVVSMQDAVHELEAGNRLDAKHNGPQIGKDGKWQYNLFDPDDVRVELMEFKNVKEPCCSPFTAANPSPNE